MKDALVIFPHQLFDPHPGFSRDRVVYLIEDPHFFADPQRSLQFHKKKLLLHRASLKAYAEKLQTNAPAVHYLSYQKRPSLELLFDRLTGDGVEHLVCTDVCDTDLDARLRERAERFSLKLSILPSPAFLTPLDWAAEILPEKGRYSQTRFYIAQRKRLGILLTQEGKPEGGRWSFDPQNRRRIPRELFIPPLPKPAAGIHVEQAARSIEAEFPEAPGSTEDFFYPISHQQAETWLDDFLKQRLDRFGDYEDAMSRREPLLFHSLLTPMLNIGLLTPAQVMQRTLDFAREYPVPLNSLEGFVRQVIGWREFMRFVYVKKGERQRTSNFWNHGRPLPKSVYRGTLGIEPLDTVIRRVTKLAYLHHIERLMLLGNFMLLCEIDPDQVYRWFMEMFIDAYDWVMVPNIYGMSQFSDGGLITTKPYISSSRYIRRMSDYPEGDWCPIWDGLFWRFIQKNRDFFEKNPRMRVMAGQWNRMSPEKKRRHLENAENFLLSL